MVSVSGDRGNSHPDHQQVSPEDANIMRDLRLKHTSLPASVCLHPVLSARITLLLMEPRGHTHTHSDLISTSPGDIVGEFNSPPRSLCRSIMRSCLTAAVLFSSCTTTTGCRLTLRTELLKTPKT